ncbi:MAG: hypothetical protein K2W97_04185 [Chthoniobacterales bacterium]|nr:hypothetical protein [Chthoniobacterales bacterium]
MLPITAILLGLAITVKHLVALLAPEPFKAFAQRFPRSPFFGKLLFGIALIWTLALALTTDLGEFSSMRNSIIGGIIIGGGLFGWLVPDFLAVRSLGFLALLAARPLLELTFLQSGALPFLISLLAYLWVIVGLFCVGMPYLLRNFITFITAPSRAQLWRGLSWIGLVYGLALLVLGCWQLL